MIFVVMLLIIIKVSFGEVLCLFSIVVILVRMDLMCLLLYLDVIGILILMMIVKVVYDNLLCLIIEIRMMIILL